MNKRIFIDKIVTELQNENLAIFMGAGLSAPAGFSNWMDLVKPFADELDLDISKEKDLVSLMQYYVNEQEGNKHMISQAILNEFAENKKITENHKILARLPIQTYWTTNYDSLMEQALEDEGKKVDVKRRIEDLTHSLHRRDAIIYKMHGDKTLPNDAIIIKDDYEKYFYKNQPFVTALKGDLVSKTFLFIGFSFSDPNLDIILSRIRVAYEKNQRPHYCFIKKAKKDSYEEIKQKLFIRDLKRFSIIAILIDNYSEITEILKIIEKKLNKNNIFISGSAYNYKPLDEIEAKNFISNLSEELIKQDYNIITGFGLGIGSLVISSVLNQIYMKNKRIEKDRLIMRPFPQESIKSIDTQLLWKKYREDMIERAGIIIIIFGNKENNGEIVEADGVYKEFEIAKRMNKFIIPVGMTGSMSKKIWKEMSENFESYYPQSNSNIKRLFEALMTSSAEDIISIIMKLINEIKSL